MTLETLAPVCDDPVVPARNAHRLTGSPKPAPVRPDLNYTARWQTIPETMRFVPVKLAERQADLLDDKSRDFLVRQWTQR